MDLLKHIVYALGDNCTTWITKRQVNESINSPHQLPHFRCSMKYYCRRFWNVSYSIMLSSMSV